MCKCLIATLNPDLDEDEVSDLYQKCIKKTGVEEDNKTYTFMTQNDKGFVLAIIAGIK